MAYQIFDQKTQYLKGYKIRIYPTESQANTINKYIDLGIAIYNWTIEQEKKQYELYKNGESTKKFLSYYDMINLFTEFRKDNPWVQEMPYGSGCKSIHRAITAFEMFFKYGANFPKFKNKKHLRKRSYGVRHDTMFFDNNLLRVEGFPRGEFIYTKYNTGFSAVSSERPKFYDSVITVDNRGRYFISFSVIENKIYINYNKNYSNPIGIDLNVRDRFVCSNGYRSGSPNLTRLKRGLSKAESLVQRDIERRKKEARTKSLNYSAIEYSNRATKRINRRRQIEDKINNTVETFIQQETAKIIKMQPTAVVMENLSVTDMDENRPIAKQIHYSNFNRCAEVMKNKCNQHNIPFIIAPSNYPSSQLCSNCGARKKIFSQKIYKCSNCGMELDRDLNAAINLVNLAL